MYFGLLLKPLTFRLVSAGEFLLIIRLIESLKAKLGNPPHAACVVTVEGLDSIDHIVDSVFPLVLLLNHLNCYYIRTSGEYIV